MDKIRGERQDACGHERRSEETKRSCSDGFLKHQQTGETVKVHHRLVAFKTATRFLDRQVKGVSNQDTDFNPSSKH